MRIYLDDNRLDVLLVGLLRKAGHTVIIPADVNLTGARDARHFAHAIRDNLVALTADRDDFLDLHDVVLAATGVHNGIVVVRFDNDAKRDMRPNHIVAAIGKLERSGLDITTQVIVLNHWR
jgi:predicted nuclease of predicted toxin-antitoxin system